MANRSKVSAVIVLDDGNEAGRQVHTQPLLQHPKPFTCVRQRQVCSTCPLFFAFFSHGAALLVLAFWADDLLIPLVWPFCIGEGKGKNVYFLM